VLAAAKQNVSSASCIHTAGISLVHTASIVLIAVQFWCSDSTIRKCSCMSADLEVVLVVVALLHATLLSTSVLLCLRAETPVPETAGQFPYTSPAGAHTHIMKRAHNGADEQSSSSTSSLKRVKTEPIE
jgi:hypothetical protein